MRLSDLQHLILLRLLAAGGSTLWEPTCWGWWRDKDRAVVSRALRRLEARGLVVCERVSGRVVSVRTTC